MSINAAAKNYVGNVKFDAAYKETISELWELAAPTTPYTSYAVRVG